MKIPPRLYRRAFAALAVAAATAAPLDAMAACSISATGVSFGSYDPFGGTAVDSSGTITVDCDVSLGYTIELDEGQSGSFSPRQMDSGGNRLDYNLYTDSARTTIWGDGSSGTSTVSGSITTLLEPQEHTVYGRIPAGQNMAVVGSYSDTITATVIF